MAMAEKVDVWRTKSKGDKMGKNHKKLEGMGQGNRDHKILNETKSQDGGHKVLGVQSREKGLHKTRESLVLVLLLRLPWGQASKVEKEEG